MKDPYKKKKTTGHNPYRPKINKRNFNTIGRYSKFMNQSIDPNDWGFGKRHQYSWPEMNDNMSELNSNNNTKHQLKSSIKYHYTYSKGKPFGTGDNRKIINSMDDIEELHPNSKDYSDYLKKWINDGKITMHKERWLCMERHLLAARHQHKAGYLFYTTSPNKEFNIICLDVDNIGSDEDYYNVVHYLSSIFPNCYYERSTNGNDLHFYILVQFNPDRLFFSDVNEGVYRNVLYYLLSEALSSFINDNFDAELDAVKGTNPLYDANNGMIKFGTLVKLPAPVKYEQFKQLYYSTVYSEHYFLRIINYLNDITCRYSSGVYTVNSLMTSLFSILKDTPIRTTPKELVSEIDKNINLPSVTKPFSSITTITNGGTNCLSSCKKNNKVGKKAKNDDYKKYTIIDIMNIGDSRTRESWYIKRYVGDYYSKHGTKPSEDEVEQNYREEMNYNKVGDFRKKRFSKYYKHTVDTFDPNKVSDGSSPYRIGMYDSVIDQTDQQITEWVNSSNGTSYKRKAYRYDVDITLEYIYICSKNKKNRAREMAIKRYAKQEGITEEQAEKALANTVSRDGLIGFYEFVKEKYKSIIIDGRMKKINGCDPKKASAMFYLVVDLGLAVCIDPTSDKGRARKFEVTDAVNQLRESWNVKQGVDEDGSKLPMVA